MNYNIHFHRFDSLRATQPQDTTLQAIADEIRGGKHAAATCLYRDLMRQAETTDEAAAKALKQRARNIKTNQNAFVCAVLLAGGRSADHVTGYTGYVMVDLDGVPAQQLDAARAAVAADPHTALAHTTLSGRGLRVVARVDGEINPNNFGRAWAAVNGYYERLTGVKADGQCKNATRMSVICHDPDVVYRPDATPLPVGGGAAGGAQHAPRTGRPVKAATAEAVVRRLVEGDGIDYAAHSHNAYVSRCLYWMNRFGVDEADALEWALRAFADYDAAEHSVATTVHSCYARTAEHATCRLADYRRRTAGRKGSADDGRTCRATLEEIEQFVSSVCRLRRNMLTHQVEILLLGSADGTDEPDSAADENTNGNAGRLNRVHGDALRGGNATGRKSPGRDTAGKEDTARREAGEGNAATGTTATTHGGTAGSDNVTDGDNAGGSTGGNTGRNAGGIGKGDAGKNTGAGGGNTRSGADAATDEGGWTPLTDEHENSLWCAMQRAGVFTDLNSLRTLILSDFVPRHHPLLHYLQSLPAWDGVTDHIGRLFAMVHCRDTSAADFDFYARRWFIGMLAGVLHDDVVNHVILVLLGPQGSYKTSFMMHLLPPCLRRYYTAKTNSQRLTKDDHFTLTENILVNLEEIDSMQRAELNQLKAMTTMLYVNERPAYGRHKVRRPHVASFCATGNNLQFLTDDTGSRRWLPFEVESIDNPWTTPIPHDAIYAQAYALLQGGFRYWLQDSEIDALNRRNRDYEAPNPATELILTHYRRPRPLEKAHYITASQIVARFGGAIRLNAVQVGRAMKKLGFERTKQRGILFWMVADRTAEQIQMELPSETAQTEQTEKTSNTQEEYNFDFQ